MLRCLQLPEAPLAWPAEPLAILLHHLREARNAPLGQKQSKRFPTVC